MENYFVKILKRFVLKYNDYVNYLIYTCFPLMIKSGIYEYTVGIELS